MLPARTWLYASQLVNFAAFFVLTANFIRNNDRAAAIGSCLAIVAMILGIAFLIDSKHPAKWLSLISLAPVAILTWDAIFRRVLGMPEWSFF